MKFQASISVFFKYCKGGFLKKPSDKDPTIPYPSHSFYAIQEHSKKTHQQRGISVCYNLFF